VAESYEEDKTLFISPLLDLTSLSSAKLGYWYFISESFVAQDELRTLFRTSPDEDWIELNLTDNFVTEWTEVSLILPDVSSTCQFAFEGNALNANGICIDYITIDQYINVSNYSQNNIEIYPNPSTGNIIGTGSVIGKIDNGNFIVIYCNIPRTVISCPP